MMGKKTKFLASPTGLVLLAVIILGLSLLIGRLLGISFNFLAALVLTFLLSLSVYLVLYLLEGRLMQKLRQRYLNNDNDSNS
jgi:K+-transporting ATPase A subunit